MVTGKSGSSMYLFYGSFTEATGTVPIKKATEKNDTDGPAVRRAIQRARAMWERISRILSREGGEPKAVSSIYKAVIQAVLLYGSESWVLTQAMMRSLPRVPNRKIHRLDFLSKCIVVKPEVEYFICTTYGSNSS